MRTSLRIILGVASCLLLAVGAYFFATGQLDSLYAYRSPLHNHPPAPGPALGAASTRRIVFVLIDALREDTSLKTDVMPFLNGLRQQGAWATMHSRPPSFSEPGYTVLLTGAWPDVSDGPTINLDYDQIPMFTQDDLFSAAHRLGLKTAVSGYNWFEKLIPQTSVNDKFYTAGEDRAADRQVVDNALPWLIQGSDQLILIHIDQVDYAGHHEGGPIDPRWDEAAHRADDLLKEIAATLDLSKDTIFICSDHGQIDRGGHGGQDPITLIEPFVIAGAGIQPGHYPDVNMVDVVPTLAALIGANIPASSQGEVLTSMLKLDSSQLAAINNAETAQQNQLLQAYEIAINQKGDPSPNENIVAYTQAAMDQAKETRLSSERLPRIFLALIAGLLPFAVIYFIRGRKPIQRRTLAWLVAGALLYILLFNLRYAVLDQRTYSMSSVTGAVDLILYCAVTAGVALLIAWLAVSLGLKVFQSNRAAAAEGTLDYVLLVIYLLSLPVLWSYIQNGLLVTWALPDFASEFVGFLCALQVLMVSVIGLALTGLSALMAHGKGQV